jgi:hypothetical protein
MALRQDMFDQYADRLGLSRDAAAVRQRVEAMEMMLERLVTIPGTNRKIGLDVMLDLIPGVGPAAAALLGGWILWEARNLGLSKWQLARMGGNIGVDFVLGAVPIIGVIPDYFFRSNTRNLRIIKRHLAKHHPASVTIDAR